MVEKHRLGRFQMLAEPIDEALVVELNKAVPDFEDKGLYPFAVRLKLLIDVLDDKIERYIELIKQQARLRGVEVVAEKASCHRQTCMTCLGVYPSHYPYFRVVKEKTTPTLYSKQGLLAFIKKNPRRFIRKRELSDFLRGLGIEEERIKRFLQYCDFRDFLVANYHCQIITFQWAGISTIRLEASEE